MSNNEYYGNRPAWENPPADWERPPPSYQGPDYHQGPPQAPYRPSVQNNEYPGQASDAQAPQVPDRGIISDTINKITHHDKPTQPHSGGHHSSGHASHPLAPIADAHLETVSLTIRDAGNDHDNLVPTHGSGSAPAFTVHYNTGDYTGQVWRGPLLFPKSSEQTIVGSWTKHKFHKDKLKFEFPQSRTRGQCEWGFNPEKDEWVSDVGFLTDHSLSWTLINETGAQVSFTLKCTDLTDDEKRVCCQVVMTSYNDGRIEIPLRIISNFEQLEEVVTVATAVMDRYRDELQ